MKNNQNGKKLAIIREYRNRINSPLMFLGRWEDFLSGDYIDIENYLYARCKICGEKILRRYTGSHFRQTHTEIALHQEAVQKYDRLLKKTFKGVLKDNGFKFKEDAENEVMGIWWKARADSMNRTLYYWDEKIEEIREE